MNQRFNFLQLPTDTVGRDEMIPRWNLGRSRSIEFEMETDLQQRSKTYGGRVGWVSFECCVVKTLKLTWQHFSKFGRLDSHFMMKAPPSEACLPVSGAPMPPSEGPPKDADEYLRQVQWERLHCPQADGKMWNFDFSDFDGWNIELIGIITIYHCKSHRLLKEGWHPQKLERSNEVMDVEVKEKSKKSKVRVKRSLVDFRV